MPSTNAKKGGSAFYTVNVSDLTKYYSDGDDGTDGAGRGGRRRDEKNKKNTFAFRGFACYISLNNSKM